MTRRIFLIFFIVLTSVFSAINTASEKQYSFNFKYTETGEMAIEQNKQNLSNIECPKSTYKTRYFALPSNTEVIHAYRENSSLTKSGTKTDYWCDYSATVYFDEYVCIEEPTIRQQAIYPLSVKLSDATRDNKTCGAMKPNRPRKDAYPSLKFEPTSRTIRFEEFIDYIKKAEGLNSSEKTVTPTNNTLSKP